MSLRRLQLFLLTVSLLAGWGRDSSAENRDFKWAAGGQSQMSASTSPPPAPPPPSPGPTWTQRAQQAAAATKRAGDTAIGFGDPAAAAAESMGQRVGRHTRETVRDALIEAGQIRMEDVKGTTRHPRTGKRVPKQPVFRDTETGRRVSGNNLGRTADELNEFNHEMNRIKGSKWGKRVQGAADAIGKFGEVGEHVQAGSTAAGEAAGGDYIGAAETGANHVLSNSAEAAGGTAMAEVGVAVGGAIGGPPGAVVGGFVGGAAGAIGAGQAYDKFGRPVIHAGTEVAGQAWHADTRGDTAQGRADITAEKENLTPEQMGRHRDIERARELLTPEAFEVWRRVWGGPERVIGPPRPEDLRDPALEASLQKIRVAIYESNVMHGNAWGLPDTDPTGELAAAEQSIFDRISELERSVEWDVAEEDRIRSEWTKREELEKLQKEQQRIAAERERRRRDAETAATMIGIAGVLIDAMGRAPQQVQQPPPASKKPHGHYRPDGTWHAGSD